MAAPGSPHCEEEVTIDELLELLEGDDDAPGPEPMQPQAPTKPEPLTLHDLDALGTRIYGQRPGTVIGKKLVQLLDYLQTLPEEQNVQDETLCKVCRFYLERPATLQSSKAATADLIEVDSRKLEPALVQLIASLMHLQQEQRKEWEAMLVSGRATPLMYLDTVKFDETPIKLSIRQHQEWLVSSRESSGRGDGPDPGNEQDFDLSAARDPASRVSVTSKVLATQNRFALLLKDNNPSEELEGQSRYYTFHGTSLTTLQVLERTTGENIFQALLENLKLSESAGHFPLRVRGSCTDQAGSNLLAEAGVVKSLGPDWCSMHTGCNAHKAATCHSKTFELVAGHVAGLVHFSLALSTANMMGKFREALATVVRQRLVVMRGSPPRAAVAFQAFALQLFGQSGTKVVTKNYLLKTWLNGHWANRDRVELYVPPGTEVSEDFLAAQVTKALLLATTSRAFKTYPRHRWTGCHEATDQVGLLDIIHGVGTAAFQVLLTGAAVPQPPPPPQPEAAAGEADQHGDRPAAMPVPIAADDLVLLQTGDEDALPQAGGEGPSDWAAKNARSQKMALQWLGDHPLPSLIMLRLVMQPLAELLFEYIKRSGQTWRDHRRASQTQELVGGPAVGEGQTSPFMAYVKLQSEEAFLAKFKGLLSSNTWSFIPQEAWSLAFQTLGFRLLSRAGALVHQLLVVPSKQCPYATFQVLVDEEIARSKLQQVPPCMQDSFTRQFLQKFSMSEPLSADARVCLETLAEHSSVDIVGVEWGHSRIQRLVSAQKVHTHLPSFEFVGARAVAGQQRSARAAHPEVQAVMERPPTVPQEEEEAEGRDMGQKVRGGGVPGGPTFLRSQRARRRGLTLETWQLSTTDTRVRGLPPI